MTKSIFKYLTLLSMMFLLCSWGEKGHHIINSNVPQFFPEGLNNFKGWSQVLAAHGSDPDNRRRTDPSEYKKHFIDIDGYDDFVKSHRIIEGKQAAINKYGLEFINKNGTLPWVTDSTYQILVNLFKAKDWSKAVLIAADLGHYVADGHMPLHLTTNYDGQLTQQKGIHSRYESRMIGLYADSLHINITPIHEIKNVQRYVFEYMYNNYQYKDSLLNADKYAFEKANHEYNDVYYRILWTKTKGFTNKMIEGSSKATAELITQAWIEAGRPAIPSEIKILQ